MHTLQNIRFPRSQADHALYIHTDAVFDPELHRELLLEKGQTVSFRTYFAVFYENDVRNLTDLKCVALALRCRGNFIVRIYRHSELYGDQRLFEKVFNFSSSSDILASVHLEPRSHLSGYLYFTIEAVGPTCFESGRWTTDEAPRNEPMLSIVMCTFKREKYARHVIETLHNSDTLEGQPYNFLLVDNSDSLPDDYFGDLPVQIFRQDNFGGAGGFTRGLLEAMDQTGHSSPTHVLLLDDDIELVPETIFRAIQLLRYQTRDLVIGAPMFDMVRPHILSVAGDATDLARNPFYPTCLRGDFDARDPAALSKLAAGNFTDFIGWWFALFSVESVKKCGLPLPLFLHNDDVEYGVRLQRLGVPSTYVGGLAVWHEPFYAKDASWIRYYDVRNSLMAWAVNDKKLTAKHVNKHLAEMVWTDLFSFNYARASILLEALDDFLQGPAVLSGSPLPTLAKIKSLYARHDGPPASADYYRTAKLTQPGQHRVWPMLLRRLTLNGHLLFWGKADSKSRPERIYHKDHFRERYCAREMSVGIYNPWLREVEIRVRNQGHFWKLLAKMVGTRLKARLLFKRACKSWKEAFPALTSESYWRDYLGLSARSPEKQKGELASHV